MHSIKKEKKIEGGSGGSSLSAAAALVDLFYGPKRCVR
jgi:hypothetical protein